MRLLALFLSLLLSVNSAFADVGMFIRPSQSGVNSPVSGQTVLFDSTQEAFYVYSAGTWRRLTTGKTNLTATTNPSVSNDNLQGYSPSSLWFNNTSGELFVCSSAATGAAEWSSLSKRLGPSDGALKLTSSDILSDFVLSGLNISITPSTLTQTTAAGIAYVSGVRVAAQASTYTYPASKDVYDYLQSDGTYLRVAVNLGDSAPSGQPGLLVNKVVTGASSITSVTAQAPSLPTVKVASASTSNHAVSLGQADARYSPISLNNLIVTSLADGQYFRSPVGGGTGGVYGPIVSSHLPVIPVGKGGLGASLSGTFNRLLAGNNGAYVEIPAPSAGLRKLRTTSSWTGTSPATEFEWVADTSGTVTDSSIAAPSDAFNTSTATSTSTPAHSITYRTNAVANRVIGSDASGVVALRDLTTNHLPVVPLAKGGTNNGSLTAPVGSIITGDGTKIIAGPTLGALQSVRMNAGGTALEAYTPPATIADGFGGIGTRSLPTSGSISGDYHHDGAWVATGALTIADGTRIFVRNCTNFDMGSFSHVVSTRANSGGQGRPASGNAYPNIGFGSGPGVAGGIGTGGGTNISGPGGPGFGGRGGRGGSFNDHFMGGGSVYTPRQFFGGTGGNSGMHASGTATAAVDGGNAGGAVYFEIQMASGTCTFGNLNANGANGVDAPNTNYSGSAGGTGGVIIARVRGTVNIPAGRVISANGGNGGGVGSGGTSNAAAGGAGGGWIDILATSLTNSGTVQANGGTAGSGGSYTATAGSAGFQNAQGLGYDPGKYW